MNFIKVLLFACLCIVAIQIALGQEEQPKPKPNPLLRRPGQRGGLKTTTTTTPDPKEVEYADEGDQQQEGDNYEDDGGEIKQEASSTTTTPEPPRRTVGPIIRPFRSNDDLLNALRKRQQNTRLAKKPIQEKPRQENDESDSQPEEQSAPAPQLAKPADRNTRKRFGIGNRQPAAKVVEDSEQAEEEEAPVPAKKPGRSRYNLGRRNANQ